MERLVLGKTPKGWRRSKDGDFPWPPDIASATGKTYAVYPGRIGRQALGWVEVDKETYEAAIAAGAKTKQN